MICAYNYIVKLANYLVKLQISACCLYFCLIKFTSDTGRYMNENLAFCEYIHWIIFYNIRWLFIRRNSTIEWQNAFPFTHAYIMSIFYSSTIIWYFAVQIWNNRFLSYVWRLHDNWRREVKTFKGFILCV